MFQADLRRGVALAAFLFCSLGHAAQVDVAGVKLDDAINLRGTALQLNGAGVRYKAVFGLYAAGLYLSSKARTPEEVQAATGSKRLSGTKLRDIDANEFGKLFTRGVEDNSPRNEMSQLIPGLLRMSQLFSDVKELQGGDTLPIAWITGPA